MAPDMQAAITASLSELERVAPQPDPTGYGVDLVCTTDLTAGLSEVANDTRQGISQALRHRISVGRDVTFIREDDPNYGTDVTGMLHRGTRPQDIAQMEGEIAEECLKDDRVASVQVSGAVSLGPPASLSFKISVTAVDPNVGTFPLVLSIGPDGVELLAE
jgi:hypothetical protein